MFKVRGGNKIFVLSGVWSDEIKVKYRDIYIIKQTYNTFHDKIR